MLVLIELDLVIDECNTDAATPSLTTNTHTEQACASYERESNLLILLSMSLDRSSSCALHVVGCIPRKERMYVRLQDLGLSDSSSHKWLCPKLDQDSTPHHRHPRPIHMRVSPTRTCLIFRLTLHWTLPFEPVARTSTSIGTTIFTLRSSIPVGALVEPTTLGS
jgi:hypothetical protein